MPEASMPPEDRTPPTAYEISYAHPLTTVCSHPATSKELLVADTHGTIFMVDWRSDDPGEPQPDRRTVFELVQPYAMGDALIGNGDTTWTSVAWRRDTTDMSVIDTPSLPAPTHSLSAESVPLPGTSTTYGT